MSGTIAATVVGSVIAGKMASDAQKKSARIQADSISEASGISREMYNAARRDILSLYDPAFSSVFDAAQGAISSLMSGRENTYDILNRTNQTVGNILKQGSQNFQSALLGAPSSQQVELPPIDPYQKEDIQYPTISQPPTREPDMAQSFSAAQRSDIQQPTVMMDVRKPDAAPGFTPDYPVDEGLGSQQYMPKNVMTRGDIPLFTRDRIERTGIVPTNYRYMGNTSGTQSQTDGPQQSAMDKIISSAGNRLDPVTLEPIDTYQNELGVYQSVPGTGLYGAEEALQQAAQGATDVFGNTLDRQMNLIGGSVSQGLQDLYGSAGMARGDISQGLQSGTSALNSALDRGRQDLQSYLASGSNEMRSAINKGRQDIQSGVLNATGYLSPYTQTGQQALQREAALSGALGADAQAAAYESFQESPGQKYLREQSERAITRNAAATGNVGGGNIARELQAQAQGLALQDLDRQMSNLQSLAQRGQSAATTSGGYEMQGADRLAGLQSQLGQSLLGANLQTGQGLASIEKQRGGQMLGANMQAGSNLADIAQRLGQQTSGLRMQGAGLGTSALGTAGQNIGQTLLNLGNQQAGMRYGAGQQIAQNQQQLTSALAGLEQTMGTNLANADQQTVMNAINIMLNQGGTQAQMATQLATLLGNMAAGQGTQQASLTQALGNANASGVTNPWGNAISSLTGMIAANPGSFGLGVQPKNNLM